MDKETISKALKELKEKSKKRNFKQSFDLIFTFKNLNLKKPEEQVEFFHTLHYSRGRSVKICALIGSELKDTAKENCDNAILSDDFSKYGDKKILKKLVREYDFFIAQANIMAQVATTFGKVLGPKGKMPNPKAGCVVPPGTNLKPLVAKLKNTVKIIAKTSPMVQLIIGKEEGDEKEIIDNIMTTYDAVVNHLPSGKNNLKRVLIKLTMSKPIKLE